MRIQSRRADRGQSGAVPRQPEQHLLASAITERPARVRLLGRSQMVPLNATAFVILTGNGLTVSEDLARRFIAVDFDPRAEDPEARRFTTDIPAEVTARRIELLAALLTIWRWGRIATVSGRDVTGPSGYPKLSLLLPLSSVITTTRTWPPDFSVRTALRRRAAS
jgi:hypothetical protein